MIWTESHQKTLKLVDVVFLLLTQPEGLSGGNVGRHLADDTRFTMLMVLGWKYSQVGKYNLEHVASDLTSPMPGSR